MPDKECAAHTRNKQTFTTPDGSAELVFISELPAFSDTELAQFYALLADNCLSFCQKSVLPTCAPSHAYVYKLRVRSITEGEALTITLTATLSDKTERRTLRSAKHSHIWKLVGGKSRYILCRGTESQERQHRFFQKKRRKKIST